MHRSVRFAALVLLAASLAVFVHHASPGMGMDGMEATAHTCVAVAAHAVGTPAALLLPVVFPAIVALALLSAFSAPLRTPRRNLAARAGPAERLLPLRC